MGDAMLPEVLQHPTQFLLVPRPLSRPEAGPRMGQEVIMPEPEGAAQSGVRHRAGRRHSRRAGRPFQQRKDAGQPDDCPVSLADEAREVIGLPSLQRVKLRVERIVVEGMSRSLLKIA